MKSVFIYGLPDLKTAIRVSRKDLLKYGEPDYYMVLKDFDGDTIKIRAIICENEKDHQLIQHELKDADNYKFVKFYSRKDKERIRVYG
jgi:hypothetical protein